MVFLVISRTNGCGYCTAAHSMVADARLADPSGSEQLPRRGLQRSAGSRSRSDFGGQDSQQLRQPLPACGQKKRHADRARVP
ncbi:hypothetical protein [Acidithiobacillus sp.]|uniref:hypothetical protein n=1 Tax=Acidithiobacillus sp. TaxID=1872118 RepID=UPI00356A5F06